MKMARRHLHKKNEKRLLVLGGGRYQLNLIKAAERRGIRTVISDYLENAPAKRYASYPTMTDALSIEANIAIAKEYDVNGVITTGTDQALNTMAAVASELNLPCYLTPESALTCTNKDKMILAVQSQDILRPKSVRVTDISHISQIEKTLKFPLVLKPADAQGQRGISMVRTHEKLENALFNAINASRKSVAIAEEFIEGPEITVSAWLKNGAANILMITDRITYNAPPALGVCFQHIFPSLHASHLAKKAKAIMENIGHAYNVGNGPLYIQMIVNNDELFFIEGSCRIGGGHECALIPLSTGVNITNNLIDLAISGTTQNVEYDFNENNIQTHATVNFLLANSGIVDKQTPPANQQQFSNGYIEGGFYNQQGHEQAQITNGLGRVGYFICKAHNRETLLTRAKIIYNKHSIVDTNDNEMIFWPKPEFINGY